MDTTKKEEIKTAQELINLCEGLNLEEKTDLNITKCLEVLK